MEKPEYFVTDSQITRAWRNANFGGDMTERQVLNRALLKCATGYSEGYTAECITRELGLVENDQWKLTPKGNEYLYAALTFKPSQDRIGFKEWYKDNYDLGDHLSSDSELTISLSDLCSQVEEYIRQVQEM